MNEKLAWHNCKNKKCQCNFDGVCRQPFMRCDINIELAFKVLKEKCEGETK